MMQISIYMFNSLIMLIMVILLNLISVAFLTLFERKIMGMFHYRKGPNKNFFIGLFQPFNDAIKLMIKEYFYPKKSSFFLYILSPSLMFMLIMMLWLIYPFMSNMMYFEHNLLYFLCMMSLGIYGLILAGWSSNSSFSMIGAIRSIAQSISYEVVLSITILILLMNINSLNLYMLLNFNKFMIMLSTYLPLSIIMLICLLAEINRTPFDLSEGESELVSGFNVEYSSSKFILIFLAEYSSMIFMMFLYCMMFFLSNLDFKFYLMIILMIFLITWIRMTYPRIRYDKLMKFCWIYLLPITLLMFLNFLINLKMNMDQHLMFS